nr:MAG TPA: hypothetical protein [Caudoviricetes sp.]
MLTHSRRIPPNGDDSPTLSGGGRVDRELSVTIKRKASLSGSRRDL